MPAVDPRQQHRLPRFAKSQPTHGQYLGTLGSRIRSRLREARGSMLPLLLGFVAIALLVAFTIGASADAYVTRKQLFSIADAAALAAADSFDLDQVEFVAGQVPRATLDSEQARLIATHYVEQFAKHGARADAVTVEHGRVHVTVTGLWDLPIASGVLPHGFEITVNASARVQFN